MMAICDKCDHFRGVSDYGLKCMERPGSMKLVNPRKTRCKKFESAEEGEVRPERVNADAVLDERDMEPKTLDLSSKRQRVQLDVSASESEAPALDAEGAKTVEGVVQMRLNAVNRHGFKAVKLSDIPPSVIQKSDAKSAWICEILRDFVASGDEAWMIDKDFEGGAMDVKGAANLSKRMRRHVQELKLACAITQRGAVIYASRKVAQ